MTGSTFGKMFSITTFGESHGRCIGVVVQGCPPKIPLTGQMIQKALDERKPGGGIRGTRRKEPDRAVVASGVFEGVTTGTPIMIMIENQDADSKPYFKSAHVYRPGHGDITYHSKYGIRDFRGGGRASARETAARVAAGAVAGVFLSLQGIEVSAYTIELGGIKADHLKKEVPEESSLRCPDPEAERRMEERIRQVKREGDSLGGVVEVIASGVPAGLGDPTFDKLDADIAKGFMSVGAVKGVEIGVGCEAARMTGSRCNDPIGSQGFESNNAGGILAGISNGDDIVARAYVKPIPSIEKSMKTLDRDGNEIETSTSGRHDICAIPRINPVLRAMMQLTIADHLLRQKALL